MKISDATEQENVHCLRTDVTTGFDPDVVENLSEGRRVMNYKAPDYSVDKCTILRAAYYDLQGNRSDVENGSWFVGYGLGTDSIRFGYGGIKVISIITDPTYLFDYETGIYVTGRTFDDFAASDPFHNPKIWYHNDWWWWDANYHNSGRDWERPANVQFFDEDGRLLLQQEAGIRIHGGGSRGYLPKSLNLYARREYDENTRFHYDFFGTGYEAKRLTLTNCGDDYYTKQKDRLVSELTADQGFATMHVEPFLLFLDGEFWGFYFLTEKYDEYYFDYYYNVPKEDVIEIKTSSSKPRVEVGTEDDLLLYQDMVSFIEESDMSVEENYSKACELIDIDSFLNYFSALIYCARTIDWPNGNFAMWRTREAEPGSGKATKNGSRDHEEGLTGEPSGTTEESVSDNPYRDGKWRCVLFDVNSWAISPDLRKNDTLHRVLNLDKNRLFASLSANPEFRKAFSVRILSYGQTIFSTESIRKTVDGYGEQMDAPMALHYARFFGEDSGLDFNQITQTEILGFFEDRYEAVENSLEKNFGTEP